MFPLTAKRSNSKLPSDEIHIWHFNWTKYIDYLPGLLRVLSQDERCRVELFHYEKDMKRFIITHGILRRLLAFYLDINPKVVQLYYHKDGKPKVQNLCHIFNIEFSLSHSEDIVLYGFCRNNQIGVDVEHIRDIPEMVQLEEEYFSEDERRVLISLHGDERKAKFFKCWVRKEAVVKATGDGICFPLNQFNVIGKEDIGKSSGKFSFFYIRGNIVQISSLHIAREVAYALAILHPRLSISFNQRRAGLLPFIKPLAIKVFQDNTNSIRKEGTFPLEY